MSPRRMGAGTTSILQAIATGHKHGADIMAVTGQGGGTVYKVLRRLEIRELIEGAWEDAEVAEAERRPRRRYYRLTAEGRSRLSMAVESNRGVRHGSVGPAEPERSR
jgi:DNA-binding PadR family transcriptional regulator